MAELDLPDLQEWMLTTCTSADATSGDGCISAARHTLKTSAVVKGSRHLTAEDRINIYARGYRARLLGCLKAEFSALHALVGDSVFTLFAHAYLQAHPPRSTSLLDLGAGFPDFLQKTRPPPTGTADFLDALPAELARLERARLETRHAPGVETDPAHHPIDPLTVITTPKLSVRTPANLRLLHLDFALTDTLAAADRGDRPPIPPPTTTHYAVARTHYHVHVLTPWQHTFLHTCSTHGIPLSAAVTATAHTTQANPTDLWTTLFTWLPFAVDAGLATVVRGLSG